MLKFAGKKQQNLKVQPRRDAARVPREHFSRERWRPPRSNSVVVPPPRSNSGDVSGTFVVSLENRTRGRCWRVSVDFPPRKGVCVWWQVFGIFFRSPPSPPERVLGAPATEEVCVCGGWSSGFSSGRHPLPRKGPWGARDGGGVCVWWLEFWIFCRRSPEAQQKPLSRPCVCVLSSGFSPGRHLSPPERVLGAPATVEVCVCGGSFGFSPGRVRVFLRSPPLSRPRRRCACVDGVRDFLPVARGKAKNPKRNPGPPMCVWLELGIFSRSPPSPPKGSLGSPATEVCVCYVIK